jgi:Putative Se/S carrier protein-like
MAKTEYAIVLFHSTQGAIKAERVLIRAGLAVKLIPTPRQLSSDCGTALRCAWTDADAVIAALQAAQVEYESVHKLIASR